MSKGEETERRILEAALGLFRRKGYAATTMRDIAAEAGMATGAAYHYFSSKQALVLRYFARKQDELDRLVDGRIVALPPGDLAGRLAAAMHAYLDSLAADRKLLGALFHGVADPDEPLSPFSRELADVRRQAIARFDGLLDSAGMPDELREAVATALWGLMMATILFFLHDGSRRQRRTRALVDAASPLVADLAHLAGLPGLEALRERALEVAKIVSSES